jgi:hypothetical protein
MTIITIRPGTTISKHKLIYDDIFFGLDPIKTEPNQELLHMSSSLGSSLIMQACHLDSLVGAEYGPDTNQ